MDEAKAGEAAGKSQKFASNPVFRSLAVRVDVTPQTNVEAMVKLFKTEFGRIDYCVNCAGAKNRLLADERVMYFG